MLKLLPRFLFLLLFSLSLLCRPGISQADNLRLLGDWTFSRYTGETNNDHLNTKSDTVAKRFSQLYRLDVNKEIFPTLTLNGGAQVEKTDLRNENDGIETDFKDSTVRPYFELELHTPLYTLVGGYEERTVKTDITGIDDSRDHSRTYTGRFEWRPTDLPSLELNYVKNTRYDDPLTRDNESQVFRLNTKYDYRDFDFLYSFLRSDDREKVEDTKTSTTTHNGRVRYFRNFLDDRLAINASLRMERSTLEFSGSGPRSVQTVPPGSGFYLLDDPDPTTNLPDEFTAVTAQTPFSDVNLGQGGPLNQVSIGLAFGEKVQADQLRVLIQADQTTLNQLTSQTFNWRVFVSDDQQNWAEVSVAGTILNRLDARYEINLAGNVNDEFIKLVTTPVTLPPIGTILVSDVQAYVDLEANQIITTFRNANFGAAYDISDTTKVIFDSSYQYRETDLFDEQSTRWSNGINLIHRFNPIFTGTTRFLVTDTWEQGKHDTSTYNYSAQMVGRYLDTLNQSLTYSGGQTKEPEGNSSFNSFILRTNAELYRGWDVSFDQGYSWQTQVEGGDSSSFFVRVQNSIVPHRRLNLVADYSMRWLEEENEPTTRSETGRLRTLWTPTDTLSLVAEARVRKSDEDVYTYWEYSANWLPFRDGTVQFNLAYSEDGDSDDDRTRSFSPSLIWNVTKNSTLTLLYTKGNQKDGDETTDFKTVLVNFRIFYD